MDCPDHGTKQVKMPLTREGSRFILLFAQADMALVWKMPVLAAARIIGISNTRFWRVAQLYMAQALSQMDLDVVKAVTLGETASKRGHNYIPCSSTWTASKSRSSSLPPARARAVWSCSAAPYVSMTAITTILQRWSATCRQPFWPPSATATPALTSS
ncbi:hypothetical protein DFAR_350007 [Desulfarculales bacterium]